jgi:hypothetical protein
MPDYIFYNYLKTGFFLVGKQGNVFAESLMSKECFDGVRYVLVIIKSFRNYEDSWMKKQG